MSAHRILFFFSHFHQRSFTGQSGTMWELAKSLGRAHDIHVLSNDGASRDCVEEGVALHLFKTWNYQFVQFAVLFPQFFIKLRRISPDVIHVHGLPLIIYVSWLSGLTGIPYVCSFNEDISLRPLWLQRRITKAISKSKGVFVSCGFYRDALLYLGVPKDKIHVAPFGLRDVFLKPPSAPPLREEERDFLYIGDARQSRGFDVVARLAEELPDKSFRLLIRWTGSSGLAEKKKVERFPNVEILQYPYAQSMVEMIRAAKVILLPFRRTSPILPPMTLVESMALGKCVMTSRLPGTEELIDPLSVVILENVEDMASISSLARKTVESPDLCRAVGERAREKSMSLFRNQYHPFDEFYANF